MHNNQRPEVTDYWSTLQIEHTHIYVKIIIRF